jgi:hypothetical protein
MAKKVIEEPLWTDFEYKLPKKGQRIKVLKEIQIEAIWDGESATRVSASQNILATEKTYWQPYDQ